MNLKIYYLLVIKNKNMKIKKKLKIHLLKKLLKNKINLKKIQFKFLWKKIIEFLKIENHLKYRKKF